jgi:FKBP-type peptidyl-prolyl cis-trans isomerase FklB
MLNKYSIIAVSLLGLWQGTCVAETSAELPMSDNDMVLYSLGYELGKDVKGQQLEFKQEMILKGAKDAMAGDQPMFNTQTQRQAMAAVRKQRAENNLRAAEAFLAENAKKAGVTTLPSGLQYQVITTGTGKVPGPKDTVTVQFRGTLIDGTEFVSTSQHAKPATLKVDKVIKGFSEALQAMPSGSKWMLYIPPQLAYGKRSPSQQVPANSAVIYEVELLSVEAAAGDAAATQETTPKSEAPPKP